MSDWYTEVEGKEKLTQGDIVFNCPVVVTYAKDNVLKAGKIQSNFIVLSQACDLENDKISNITLAEVLSMEQVNTILGKQNNTNIDLNNSMKRFDTSKSIKNFGKEINKNAYPRYQILDKYKSLNLELPFSIIDFSEIHNIPSDYFKSQLVGLGYRLRINSPYRELIAQRFGSFYSRIGLPTVIGEELEKDLQMINSK